MHVVHLGDTWIGNLIFHQVFKVQTTTLRSVCIFHIENSILFGQHLGFSRCSRQAERRDVVAVGSGRNATGSILVILELIIIDQRRADLLRNLHIVARLLFAHIAQSLNIIIVDDHIGIDILEGNELYLDGFFALVVGVASQQLGIGFRIVTQIGEHVVGDCLFRSRHEFIASIGSFQQDEGLVGLLTRFIQRQRILTEGNGRRTHVVSIVVFQLDVVGVNTAIHITRRLPYVVVGIFRRSIFQS